VVGYDVIKCPSCFCRPERQPDVIGEAQCPPGAPPATDALLVVCCESEPARDGEVEVLTQEEAVAGDAWYSLATGKVGVCHSVVRRTLGYHAEPTESSILHFLTEKFVPPL